QFHPESILTERGPDLVANFLAAPRPTPRAAPRPRATAPSPARVEVPGIEPERAAALFADSELFFWLDSARGGRFSYLGDGDARFRATGDALELDGRASRGRPVRWLPHHP